MLKCKFKRLKKSDGVWTVTLTVVITANDQKAVASMTVPFQCFIHILTMWIERLPMHIWIQSWLLIYEHHNHVRMLLSVTFDEIATLRVWNSYQAHNFVACSIKWLCPFLFVADPVCCHFGLWTFRFVGFPFVVVLVCWCFGVWPFRFLDVFVLPFQFTAIVTRNLNSALKMLCGDTYFEPFHFQMLAGLIPLSGLVMPC